MGILVNYVTPLHKATNRSYIERMMDEESYTSTIEDHGEGSIFVAISGIRDVDEAEEELEMFNEIIKNHTN